MKTFQQKKESLAVLKEKLGRAKVLIFTSFSREGEKGLSVVDMRGLRKGLKESQGEYLVDKKTLVNLALKDKKVGADIFQFPGSLGLAFGYGDEIAVARSLYNFSKKNPVLKFFGALFGNEFINEERLVELARLPGREALIARLLGTMNYPIAGLARVLQGNIRGLVVALGRYNRQSSNRML